MKFARVIVMVAALFMGVALSGCGGTGVSLLVGERSTYPDITYTSENLSLKLYEDVKGASLWAHENTRVFTSYRCTTTNEYFGIIKTQSNMKLNVKVVPTTEAVDEEANIDEEVDVDEPETKAEDK